jgi:hypothetical protein
MGSFLFKTTFMQKKTLERIQFIKENPTMSRTKLAKVLSMQPQYLTTFADTHGLVLKTNKELVQDIIRNNTDRSCQDIAKIVLEEIDEEYEPNYISTMARDLEVTLPRSVSENPATRKKPEKQEEPEVKLIIRIANEEKKQSPDYKKPRKERCPAVYSQTSSPYGFSEKLGITVKTIKR